MIVTWTDSQYNKIREENIDFAGSKTKLARSIGEQYLKDLQAKKPDKKMRLIVTDRAAVIASDAGVEGTVAVEDYQGQKENRILNWIMKD